MWLSGTGFMQLCKLSYDYDYGYAIGGTGEVVITYTCGINFTMLLADIN